MNVAIVGCGLIGNKRFKALGEHKLVAAADVDLARAKKLGSCSPDIRATSEDWGAIVRRDDVDLVIVATTNDALAPVALEAARAGKHLLIEKPAARSFEELAPLAEVAARNGVRVKIGFNHRFHPAILKAHAIAASGQIGPIMFLRGRYGHGGRVGYDREWRADPNIAGGGEMLDQGVHLIDLARWFMGEFPSVSGAVGTFFWDMPVEDNGFALLKTAAGQVAWLHASCTEWKNMFCLEIYGKTGKLQIDGLGGSYGVERLTHYQMLPQMGPPPTTIWEYPGDDSSWRTEFEQTAEAIKTGQPLCGDLDDALASLKIVQTLYAVGKP